MIKTPNGYIVASAVESFRVVYSPGYHDHQHVIVTLTSGRNIDTGMYEEDFLRAYGKFAWSAIEMRQMLATIDAAYEERDRLRTALSDIAYNTSSSVPLGQWPVDHYRDMMHRCIGIAARALEGRE